MQVQRDWCAQIERRAKRRRERLLVIQLPSAVEEALLAQRRTPRVLQHEPTLQFNHRRCERHIHHVLTFAVPRGVD